MKILIIGGHLSPALAVIEYLKGLKDVGIIFIGRKNSLEGSSNLSQEYIQIKNQNIPFIPITTGRLQRVITRHTIPSLLKIPVGLLQSFKIVLREKPDCILSFGSYVAVPICFTAWFLNIPVFTHEQTITLGLANKIITKLARKIFVSWPSTISEVPSGKGILTGNPLRKDIFNISGMMIPDNIKKDISPLLYITGGSQGSESINKVILQSLPELLGKYRVIHQYGQSKLVPKFLENFNNNATETQRHRYYAIPFIKSENIGWVFNKASIVIGRSGANTISELLALKKPALLIPLPWAGKNEQQKNALILEKIGLARILNQQQLNPDKLCNEINYMINHIQGFNIKNKELDIPDGKNAAKTICSYIFQEVSQYKHANPPSTYPPYQK